MSRRFEKHSVSNATRKASSTATAKDASTTASTTASKAVFHFLRIPKEIRFKIYGYLFLGPPCVDLDAYRHDDPEWHFVPGTLKRRELEVEAEMATILQIPKTECNGMFDQPLDGYYKLDQEDGDIIWHSKPFERHLAILRTSRQINNEASALLHSDLTIYMKLGDASPEIHGYALMNPRPWHIWRHDPSKGLGFMSSGGQKYKSRLLDGYLEPHVFAPFEKVCYVADFSHEFYQHAPRIHINDDLSVRAEDAANFVSYLTTTKRTLEDVAGITISSVPVTKPSPADIFQKLVDLLSNSPFIRHLEVRFDVAFSADSDLFEDLGIDSDDDPDSEQEEENAKTTEKREVAFQRVTELFLESGVLNCLRKLSNVKRFSLEFGPPYCGREVITFQQKHLNIIRDLKERIEKKWVLKHGSR